MVTLPTPPAPILGATTDTSASLTLMGQLLAVVAQTIPQSGGAQTANNVACGAGVNVLMPAVTLPAGKRIYAILVSSNAAAGTLTAMGVGTGAALVGNYLIEGYSPVPLISMGHLFGINYSTNTSIWVFTAVAANVAVTVWTA